MFEAEVEPRHRYGSRGFRVGHSSQDIAVFLEEVREVIRQKHVVLSLCKVEVQSNGE